MAKKKNKLAKPAPKDFSSNPFKSLKGLSAFESQNNESPGLATGQRDSAKFHDADDQENDAFVEEMAVLGVKQIKEFDQEISAIHETGKNTATEPAAARDESDKAVFLQAIGNMEKVFKDEYPGDMPEKRALPRRIKQVERGQLIPEDELDLHGLNVDEARIRALFFMQNAIHQGFGTVLLITGRGLHSASGPVLRNAMEELLSEQSELVVEWAVAPRRYGGEGALVVFLRQPGQKAP